MPRRDGRKPLAGREAGRGRRLRVTYDDSIITDTSAEKQQDMAEVAAGLMEAREYRAKWYGEDEATARGASARTPEHVPPTT